MKKLILIIALTMGVSVYATEKAQIDSVSAVTTTKVVNQLYVGNSNTLVVTNDMFTNSNFVVYQMNGVSVLKGKLKSNSYNLSKLPKGFYIVMVKNFHSVIELK